MIKVYKRYRQIVIMVNEGTLRDVFLKSVMGLLLYYASINIVLYSLFGSVSFTPEAWLWNPIHNLVVVPNLIAWFLLFVCEYVGWNAFETKSK